MARAVRQARRYIGVEARKPLNANASSEPSDSSGVGPENPVRDALFERLRIIQLKNGNQGTTTGVDRTVRHTGAYSGCSDARAKTKETLRDSQSRVWSTCCVLLAFNG